MERCARCNGEMYLDVIRDPETGRKFTAKHCIKCGEVVDHIIEHNRTLHKNLAQVNGLGPLALNLIDEDTFSLITSEHISATLGVKLSSVWNTRLSFRRF